MRRKRAWWIGCVIGLAALAVRLLYLQQVSQNPLFEVPVAEARACVSLAVQLSGGYAEEDVQAPRPSLLYPLFLAGIFRLGGERYALPRLAQAVLGAISCTLLWLLGRAVFGPAVGLGAAVIAILYGPLIYFGGELLPATAIVFFALLLLLALLWADRGAGAQRFWVPGGALGLGFLAGAQTGVVALVVAGWLWQREEDRTRAMAAFCLGVALVVGPALAFSDEARRFATEHASVSLDGLGHNLFRFWRGAEWLPELDPYYGRGDSALLAALLWRFGVAFPFGVVAPLGLLGLGFRLCSRERGRAENLVLLFVAAGAIGTALSEVTSQSRLPVVTALLPLAVIGVLELGGRERPWSQRMTGIAALVLLGFFLNAEASGLGERGTASHHYWLGYAYERLGMKANAIREYREAVSAGADRVEPYAALGALYSERGAHERAIGAYQDLLARWPPERRARQALGDQYMRGGQAAAAAAVYAELLVAGEDSTLLLGRLGDALGASGNLQGARRAYREMLEVSPDSGRVRYQLARIYEAGGLTREAIGAYCHLLRDSTWAEEAALRLVDLLIEIDRVSGRLGTERETGWWQEEGLIENGDLVAVERLLQKAHMTRPGSAAVLWGLSRILYWQGRNTEALPLVERLRELEPEDYRVYFFLSKLYGSLGRKEAAQNAFKGYQREKRRAEIHQRVEVERDVLLKEVSGEGQ